VKIVVEESDPIPRFAKESYAEYIDENVEPPVEIIDLTSSDEQRKRAVRYEIVEGNEGMFVVIVCRLMLLCTKKLLSVLQLQEYI